MRSALLVMLVACRSAAGTAVDAGAQSCDQLAARMQTLVQDPGPCTTAADCQLVGGTPAACVDGPFILACGGFGISTALPGLAALQASISEYGARHCSVADWAVSYDCAPSELQCIAHECSTYPRSCLPTLDAGVQ